MPFDIYVSYSREDNRDGRITELIARIREEFRRFAGGELTAFLDPQDPLTGEEARKRAFDALAESSVLLMVLSPAHLESAQADWEIEHFLRHGDFRAADDEFAPIFFIEAPGADTSRFDQQSAAWLGRVRRDQGVELRPWLDEGANNLRSRGARTRLADLDRPPGDRISTLRRIDRATGNLTMHNPYFVGREAEMRRLHESAGLGRVGILTAVQGMGGLGKTALAIQYAHAYADFFPGGRWLVQCASKPSLASAIRSLDRDVGITLSEDEKADDVLAARRVLAELEARATRGVEAVGDEMDAARPRTLLLLDNVDDSRFLRPPQTDITAGKPWLHVLATTRLGADDFGYDPHHQTLIALDELPLDDAVRLIERHQPDGRFSGPTERDAARRLAEMLGGLTLAVEVAAVYLGERKGQVTCEDLLHRLKSEGVWGIEGAAQSTRWAVGHGEKTLEATLGPTLDILTPEETLVLRYAALLPPDLIPLSWLRALAAMKCSGLEAEAKVGYAQPWLDIARHLIDLRLLQVVEIDSASGTPKMVRLHRLVGEVVRAKDSAAGDHLRDVIANAKKRCNVLKNGWLDHANRWELEPLASLAYQLMDTNAGDAAPVIANDVGLYWRALGRYADAELLLRRALEIREQTLGPDHPSTLTSVNNLGLLLENRGDAETAEKLYRRAVEAATRTLGQEAPLALTYSGNLGAVLLGQCDYAGAEPLLRRVLEARERILGPDHPDTLGSVNNLAHMLDKMGNRSDAELLYRRVTETAARVLGDEHPKALTYQNNFASMLKANGDYQGAEPLFRKVLDARERILGRDHPDTLLSLNNLARLFEDRGEYRKAEPLFRRALDTATRTLGPDHPMTLLYTSNLAMSLLQQGDIAGAEPLLRFVLARREQIHGQDHPTVLDSVVVLGKLLYTKREYAGALTLTRRALEARERIYAADHPKVLVCVDSLATILNKTGDWDEARTLHERAATGTARVFGPEHPRTLTATNNLGVFLYRTGEIEQAEVIFRDVFEASSRILGPDHPITRKRAGNLQKLLQAKTRAKANSPSSPPTS